MEEKVTEWNDEYEQMNREMHLKNMSPEAYEAEVGNALLDVCDGDVDLALTVFNHPNNEGGWMYGDMQAFLEKKKAD